MTLVSADRRTMRTLAAGITALTVSLTVLAPAAKAADLVEAKTLYANASYDEAIQELHAIHDADKANQVDQYLALCLIALGRTDEAEQPLEQIVTREPLYVLNESDTSPKLLDLFHQVRRRVLPKAALDAFTKGRADYEAKRYSAAVDEFKRLIDISKDPEAGDSVGALKELGDGFLTLSQSALAASAPPPAPAAPAPAAGATTAHDAPARVYTAADAGVVGPTVISRQLPPWQPADTPLARREYRGALTVVIDERGAVESANLAQPITPQYDRTLLAATKTWKFIAATKDGKPVKYLTTIQVLLRPADR